MGKSKREEKESDPIRQVLKAAHQGDVIRIRANNLNDENQVKIRDYIEEKEREITVFNVQGSIGMKGLQRFSPILCNHVSTLKRLHLKANDLRVPAVLDLVCALQLPQNKALEVLDLSSNPIGSEGFKVLMANCLLNTTLAALLVSKCSIGDSGVVHSQPYIKDKRRPDGGRFYINLSQNNVGSEGHSAIVAAIPSWMSLSLTRQKPPVILASPAMQALPLPAALPPASPLRDPEPDSLPQDAPGDKTAVVVDPPVEACSEDEEEEDKEEEEEEEGERETEQNADATEGSAGSERRVDAQARIVDEPPQKRRIVCIKRQPTRLVPVQVGSQQLLGILRPLDSTRRLVEAVLE